MPDVFDGIPIERHTGQGSMTVSDLRLKYGAGLTFTANPMKFRIVRAWERSQVMVITIHFQDHAGNPVAGVIGTFGWPDGLVAVKSNNDGNIDWAFGVGSFYDARAGETGPYTFRTVDGALEIRGLGSPNKNATINHDSMSFDVEVNPPDAALPPPPDPGPTPGGITLSDEDVRRIRAAAGEILSVLDRARS